MLTHVPLQTPAYVPWSRNPLFRTLDDTRKSALCLLRAKTVDSLDTQLTLCLVMLPQGKLAYLNRTVNRGKQTFELAHPVHLHFEGLELTWDSIRTAHTLYVLRRAEELEGTRLEGASESARSTLTETILDSDELAEQWKVWAKTPELEPLVSVVLPSSTVQLAQSQASAILATAALAHLGAEQSRHAKCLLSTCAAGKLKLGNEEVPPAAAVGFAQVLDLVCEALPDGAADLRNLILQRNSQLDHTQLLSDVLRRMPEMYWSPMQTAVDAFFQSNPSLAARKALAGENFDYAGPLPVRYPLALAAGRLLDSCAETLMNEVLDFE